VIAIYASRIRFSRRLVAQDGGPRSPAPSAAARHRRGRRQHRLRRGSAARRKRRPGARARPSPTRASINVARVGARIGHVRPQLEGVDIERADLVLIHAGANDVLEFRSVKKVEQDARCGARPRRRASAPNVILMPGHNFSVAAVLPAPDLAGGDVARDACMRSSSASPPELT
jgi:hypothetical protein